jgi:hypothetical protein
VLADALENIDEVGVRNCSASFPSSGIKPYARNDVPGEPLRDSIFLTTGKAGQPQAASAL